MLSSTAIIAEILIVGVQAAAWLTVALSWTSAPLPWTSIGDDLLMITLSVALLYTLGVLVDRLSDSALDGFRELRLCWRNDKKEDAAKRHAEGAAAAQGEPKDPEPSFATKRLTVMHRSDGMSSFLEYIRSRLRIARATTLNAAILFAVLLGRFAVVSYAGGTLAGWEAGLLVAAFLTMVLAYRVNLRIAATYEKRLHEMYEVLKKEKNAPPAA